MNWLVSKLYKNARGQMAVFVALIFQVLFVFFAMAINIALAVHDKINLQNAVDLSAYYAAQRQAEILNVIAHTNYQIRQSWKLLNFRYYVMGTMGMGQEGQGQFGPPHPSRASASYPRADDVLWPPAETPVLCVTYQPIWLSGGSDDNPCKAVDFHVPNIVIPKTIAPFTATNLLFEGLARTLQKKIEKSCTAYAGQNWLFGALSYVAYMNDQRTRKELIRALAQNLAKPPDQMVDLNGDLISFGARKTFMKNLTAANANTTTPPEFRIYNSLVGRGPQEWLPEIDVIYTMMYSDLLSSASECRSVIRTLQDKPGGQAWADLQTWAGNPEMLDNLMNVILSSRSISVGDSRRLSVGVEKNPWLWAYIGVKAKSRPRQLFFPFGEPITFEAEAYAQPFGGRVGPWYGSLWSRGATSSSGELVQLSPAKLLAGGMMNSETERDLLPQYSKYPGDQMGLRSPLAQNSLTNLRGLRVAIQDYFDVYRDFGIQSQNDVLAFSDSPASNARQYEIAAIAPDLFDVTYYSIQSNFGRRYLPLLQSNRQKLAIPDGAYPRGDLGVRGNDEQFSVQDQIDVANGRGIKVNPLKNLPPSQIQAPDAFWYVREHEHLLTSWVHNDTYGQYFAFPDERFGKCAQSDERFQMRAPGGCMDMGGRAGYSVKIVSPEMFETALPLGGSGQSTGKILNPPPPNW